jgi:hypothetical protein
LCACAQFAYGPLALAIGVAPRAAAKQTNAAAIKTRNIVTPL